MFKNHGPSPWTFLTKWTDLTKGKLQYRCPLWGTFEIPEFTFLKTELENLRPETSKTEWNTYFDWHFGTSKCYQEFKINFAKYNFKIN